MTVTEASVPEPVAVPAPDAGEKVQVAFFSHTSKYVVGERPVLLPLHSSPRDLSALLVHLLEAGGEVLTDAERAALSFGFLLEGRLLVGGGEALREAMLAQGCTLERTVRLEYVEAGAEPQPLATGTQPDWIRTVVAVGAGGDEGALTGGADGVIRHFRHADPAPLATPLATRHAPGLPITALAAAPAGTGLVRVVSGSLDQQALLHHLTPTAPPALDELCQLVLGGEPAPITAAAILVHARHELVAVATHDGRIALFSARPAEPEDDCAPGAPPSDAQKRRRVAPPPGPRRVLRRPRFVLEAAHAGAVTGLHFLAPDADAPAALPLLLSCGLDGSVKGWDLAAQAPAFILHNDAAPVTAFAVCRRAGVLTAHPDGSVRAWALADALRSASALCPRTFFAALTEAAFRGRFLGLHAGWISAVVWLPGPGPVHVARFATAGCDGHVRVWDTRALPPASNALMVAPKHRPPPLHDLLPPGPRPATLLALHAAPRTLLAGGEACVLHAFHV